MCGIAGIIRLDGGRVDQSQLDRLTDALAHRGPDGRGTHVDGSVGLGHRRLSILDLSNAAAQPMTSDDGQITIVFNGEIYNFKEKRAELEARGYRFTSSGDTEVLLKLYEEYGEACVDHLRGMFAFAVHDKKRNVVLLARDRLGKKPIKYVVTPSMIAFASELKALKTLPDCPNEIDQTAVHHFLTMMYVPAPLTGFAGIKKLPAAHCMTIDLSSGVMKERRYWALKYAPDTSVSVESWKEQITAKFAESVGLRMIADVPVGAFLSGGIDSAAVVAAMSKQSAHPVKTFSIGSTNPSFNELPDALRIAQKFGTDHHPITLDPDIVKLLPELVQTYEEPFADPSSIPTYLVAREARKHVTVALNGDGGDENFAGYVRYPILRFSQTWGHVPGPLHALIGRGTSLFDHIHQTTFSYRANRFQQSIGLSVALRHLQYLSFFTEEEKKTIEHGSFPRTDEWYASLTADARARGDDPVHQAMSADIGSYLADDLLPKVDLGTMAHSLEARSPFLDHEFMELTATIPSNLKLHGKSKKWILKEALRGVVPDETLQGKKRGFRLPLDEWFRHDLKSYVQQQIMDAPPQYWSMFDRAGIEAFLREYHDSRINYSDHVWALLWLSQWMRTYT